MFQIIKGIDGSYMVKEGQLLKIIAAEYSSDWFVNIGGWAKYTLSDGSIVTLR